MQVLGVHHNDWQKFTVSLKEVWLSHSFRNTKFFIFGLKVFVEALTCSSPLPSRYALVFGFRCKLSLEWSTGCLRDTVWTMFSLIQMT